MKAIYQKRKDDFQSKAEALKQRYNRLAIVRIVAFLLGVAAVVFLFSLIPWYWAFWGIPAFLLVFNRLIKSHLKIDKERIFKEHLTKVNQWELDMINRNWGSYQSGESYLDPMHPYSVDLDIFGAYSFFQYTNRAVTEVGRRAYAKYLTKLLSEKKEVDLRQEAGQELAKKLEWRQAFQAIGIETEDNPQHIQYLQKWLDLEDFVLPNRWLLLAQYFVPIWMLAGTFLAFYCVNFWIFIGFLLLPGLILRKYILKINEAHQLTANAEKVLAQYGDLIGHLEIEDFSSIKMDALQKGLGQGASSALKRLSYIISQLNVRYNAFAVVLNLYGLWDIAWMRKLEQWKADHGDHLLTWFDILAEAEALVSLGTLEYNHKDWTYPNITKGAIVAQDLGHPLIASEERINNNFDCKVAGHIKLITGSNMAGKSTFLRTVGLNIVLGNIGAPVCAKQLDLPLMQVYTSMRSQDALHESTSSFYAELKRLKVIIESVEADGNVFFVLDEILKGTNSTDRHTGGKALIQQLIQSKGTGLIATHDLELGALEASSKGTIENWCMEVEVKGDELDFDYKLKRGVSKSFNATHLMRNMGIKI